MLGPSPNWKPFLTPGIALPMVLPPGQKRPLEQSFDRSGDGSGAENSLDSTGYQPPIHANNVDAKDSSHIEPAKGWFFKISEPLHRP